MIKNLALRERSSNQNGREANVNEFRPRSQRHLTGIVCASLFLLTLQGCTEKTTKAVERNNTVPVTVAPVSVKAVPVTIRSVGNVEAFSTIQVKAQVTGELIRANFKEGDSVKKGDILIQIDPRSYESTVNQVEANLARDTAQLSQSEANLARDIAQEKYSKEQAQRYAELFHQGVISKGQFDQFDADAEAKTQAVRADRAAIDSARASVNATKAALERARLDLSYCTIRSPINGRTGSLLVKPGNLVSAVNVNLLTINEVQPIYVSFNVPETQLPAINRYKKMGTLKVMAKPSDSDAPTSTDQGELTFVDNAVDLTTGTIKLKATFKNSDSLLWPGQFVDVMMTLTTQSDALVIPSNALQHGPNGEFVFIAKKDNTAEVRPIKTGMLVDEELVVSQGLQPGESVVTEGQLRLTSGARVSIKNQPGSKK